MPVPAEGLARRLAARGILVALLILAALPAYLLVDPAWRPVVIRLACTLLVIAVYVRVRRGFRQAIEADEPSALDAPRFTPPAPEPDTGFTRARKDLVFSRRNRRYFDTILWPRLLALAGGTLAPPAARSARGRRGPTLSTLERLIAEVEARR
jgi:hypothetical protein